MRCWYSYRHIADHMVELKVYNCDDNDLVMACARIPDDEIMQWFTGMVTVMGGTVKPDQPKITIMEKRQYYPPMKHKKVIKRTKIQSQNRKVTAFRLRMRGATFTKMGKYFGVCSQRARQLHFQGLRLLLTNPDVRARFPRVAMDAEYASELKVVKIVGKAA